MRLMLLLDTEILKLLRLQLKTDSERLNITHLEIEWPVQVPWYWVEPYPSAEVQHGPPCQAVFGDESAFSPPVPSGSCRFFLPGSGSTHPRERKKNISLYFKLI